MIFLFLHQSCPRRGCSVPACPCCDSEHPPGLHEAPHKHHSPHPALLNILKITLRLPLLSALSSRVLLPLYSWKLSYKEEYKAKLWSCLFLGLPRVILSGTPQTHPGAHLLHSNCPVPGVWSLRSYSPLLSQKNIHEKTVFTTLCAWDQFQKKFYLLPYSLDCQPARITNNVSHC